MRNFVLGGKSKGKSHPKTGHEGPKGEQMYSCSFFNLGAGCGWMVNATPRPLYPQERPGTHCIGGWVGLRAGLDGCGKSRPTTGIRSSSPQRVAIPTELSRPTALHSIVYLFPPEVTEIESNQIDFTEGAAPYDRSAIRVGPQAITNGVSCNYRKKCINISSTVCTARQTASAHTDRKI